MKRGRYFTIPQAVEAYPAFSPNASSVASWPSDALAFTYAGRGVVLAEADIEDYREGNPPRATRRPDRRGMSCGGPPQAATAT